MFKAILDRFPDLFFEEDLFSGFSPAYILAILPNLSATKQIIQCFQSKLEYLSRFVGLETNLSKELEKSQNKSQRNPKEDAKQKDKAVLGTWKREERR